MDNIVSFLNNSQEIVKALVALIILVIVSWKAIQETIKRKASEAKLEALPMIFKDQVIAETSPLDVYPKVSLPPLVSPTSNEGKNNIVRLAFEKKNPGLLKKMKLKDALALGNFVSDAYQMIKPVIKEFKK